VQYVRNQLGMQVCAIAKLADLLLYLEQQGGEAAPSIMSACWPTVSVMVSKTRNKHANEAGLACKLSLYVVATVWAGAMPAQPGPIAAASTPARMPMGGASRPTGRLPPASIASSVCSATPGSSCAAWAALTDQERSAQEAKRRQDQAEQQRLREERSRERRAGALPQSGRA
jgi:hypothetical protein